MLHHIAWIEEDACIGCTKCIAVCPVDAILGAENLLHQVLREECIGCRLCIDPCPVDCISMVPYQHVQSGPVRVQKAQRRIRARRLRLQHAEQAQQVQSQQRKQAVVPQQDHIQLVAVDPQVSVDRTLDMQIRKAEQALQRAGKGQQAYGRTLLEQLYQKRAERDRQQQHANMHSQNDLAVR